MSRPVLLKLGGSIITDKSKGAGIVARTQARRLVIEVRKAGVPCIIVHGAGSMGHPQVTKAESEGYSALNVSAVHAAVGELQATLVRLAVDAGVPAVAVPLHVHCTREGDEILGIPFERIRRLLSEGHVPVLGGSLIRDADSWCVLSGDRIVGELAAEFQPRLTVFATDVDGVLADPEDPGSILAEVGNDTPVQWRRANNGDVTGAMRGKLEHAVAAADHGPVVILNGTEKNRLLDQLKGKTVPCTRVKAASP